MPKIGTVHKQKGDFAVVFLPKDKACDSCPSCAGCGAKGIYVTVGNPLGAETGDIVEISESEKSSLPMATLVFIAPVLLPVAAFSALSAISQIVAVVGVAVSLILWGAAVYFANKKINHDPSRTGAIVRIIKK